jgi:hypothetical protein
VLEGRFSPEFQRNGALAVYGCFGNETNDDVICVITLTMDIDSEVELADYVKNKALFLVDSLLIPLGAGMMPSMQIGLFRVVNPKASSSSTKIFLSDLIYAFLCRKQ